MRISQVVLVLICSLGEGQVCGAAMPSRQAAAAIAQTVLPFSLY